MKISNTQWIQLKWSKCQWRHLEVLYLSYSEFNLCLHLDFASWRILSRYKFTWKGHWIWCGCHPSRVLCLLGWLAWAALVMTKFTQLLEQVISTRALGPNAEPSSTVYGSRYWRNCWFKEMKSRVTACCIVLTVDPGKLGSSFSSSGYPSEALPRCLHLHSHF